MIIPGKYRGEHCILVAPEWYDGAAAELIIPTKLSRSGPPMALSGCSFRGTRHTCWLARAGVYLAPGGEPLTVTERDGRCEIEVSRLDIHAMVVFE